MGGGFRPWPPFFAAAHQGKPRTRGISAGSGPASLGFQAVSSRFFTARLGGRPCNYIGPGRRGQFGAEPAGEEPGIEEGSDFSSSPSRRWALLVALTINIY